MDNCQDFEKIKQEPKETLEYYKIYCYCNRLKSYVTKKYCKKCRKEIEKSEEQTRMY